MIKYFELWLDESGDFKDESQLKNTNLKASLIGGLLIEKAKVDEIDFNRLLPEEDNHAMDFSDEQKREYQLHVLEQMRAFGAKQVFFENTLYIDKETSKQLYLEMMAEGLIQLLSTLDATYESVGLEVLIAQRQNVSESGMKRINEAEYLAVLMDKIEKKKQQRRIIFDDNTQIHFQIGSAYRDKKLMIADFACNARLTRDSKAYRSVRPRLENLHQEAFIFAFNEKLFVNFINGCLNKDSVSEAVLELYTATDAIRPETKDLLLGNIVNHLKNVSYRVFKSQMKRCAIELETYAQTEDDYSFLEQKYKDINETLVSKLEAEGLSCAAFKFNVLLQLSDAYLRDGDIVNARKTVLALKKAQYELDDSLENLLSYHQLLEKEALLYIDEFDYSNAIAVMKKAGTMYSFVMEKLPELPEISDRFKSFKSEYYGDVLCMQIYAMMFLQRGCPSMTEEIRRLSDVALTQYPNYPGELERHLQYRSHIELEAGNYEMALDYLYQSVPFDGKGFDLDTLRAFLDAICAGHQNIGCQYYLMYFLLIVVEAKLNGHGDLADRMMAALKQQKELMAYGDLGNKASYGQAVELDLSGVAKKTTGMLYHPQEVICWKYATYLMLEGKYESADRFYAKALSICEASKNCHTMLITSLGIEAEKLYSKAKSGEEKAVKIAVNELLLKIQQLKKDNLTSETVKFIEKIEIELGEVVEAGKPVNADALWQASRYIAY